jgi:hypothetical protein
MTSQSRRGFFPEHTVNEKHEYVPQCFQINISNLQFIRS